MAITQELFSLGFLESDTNLNPYGSNPGTNKQYTAMKLAAEGQFTPVTAIGDEVAGILQDHPSQGEGGKLVMLGVAKMHAGGAVDANQDVYMLVDGTCVNLAGAASGARLLGKALKSAVTGDVVSLILANQYPAAPLKP